MTSPNKPARSVFTSAWRVALRTTRRTKRRAAAMGATLGVGVLAITLTVATGEGARAAVEKSFRSMLGAFDVVLIQPGGPTQRGWGRPGASVSTLTPDDVRELASSVPNVSAVSMAQIGFKTELEANGKNGTTTLFGVTPSWFRIRGDSIAVGGEFSDEDAIEMRRVAVIGTDVARKYFGTRSAVGQRLRASGVDLEVVGVLAPNGAGPGGASLDNILYVPFETSRRRVLNRENVDLATLKLVRADGWAATQAAVTTFLRNRHGIRPPALDDFQVTSPEALISQYAKVDSTLRRAFFWVGFLALLIGGVVVASLMHTAVTARRQEIGTRRALGATRRDIFAQFWAEAIIVSALAALTGTMVGVLVTQGGARMMHAPLAVSWTVTLAAAALTLVVGMIAGYFPARRAASESPAAALRTSA